MPTERWVSAAGIAGICCSYLVCCQLITVKFAEGLKFDGKRWKVEHAIKSDFKYFGWKWVEGESPTPSPARSAGSGCSPHLCALLAAIALLVRVPCQGLFVNAGLCLQQGLTGQTADNTVCTSYTAHLACPDPHAEQSKCCFSVLSSGYCPCLSQWLVPSISGPLTSDRMFVLLLMCC